MSIKEIIIKSLNEQEKRDIPRYEPDTLYKIFNIKKNQNTESGIKLATNYPNEEVQTVTAASNTHEEDVHTEFVDDLMEFDDVEDFTETTNNGSSDLVELQTKLLSAIEAIINVRWSSAIKPLTEPYLRMGLPNGNPFTIVLNKNDTTLVPATYFEIIRNPMDLSTIKQRVKDFSYDDINAFEADLNLVCSNALFFHKFHKDPIRRMAKAVSKRTKQVLENLKTNLKSS